MVSAPASATFGQPGGTATASGGSGTGAYSFSAAGSTACTIYSSTGVITVTKELVGDRPAGSTPENSPIVKNGLAVATVLGFNANLGEGSTDSNTPMSLKVPAITVGGGGRGRDAHALTESFDTTDAWQGTQYAILLAVALAQK